MNNFNIIPTTHKNNMKRNEKTTSWSMRKWKKFPLVHVVTRSIEWWEIWVLKYIEMHVQYNMIIVTGRTKSWKRDCMPIFVLLIYTAQLITFVLEIGRCWEGAWHCWDEWQFLVLCKALNCYTIQNKYCRVYCASLIKLYCM